MRKTKKFVKTDTSHYARCRTLMLKFQSRHRIRFLLTSIVLFSNCYFHVIALPVLRYGDMDRFYALLWGMFAFLINLVIFVTVFFASAERLNLVYLLLILVTLSTVIGFLHPYAGLILGILFLTQVPECLKMRWIQKQQGYPYFNERYQQQMDLKRLTSEFIDDEEEKEAVPVKKRPAARYDDIVIFSMPKEK